MKLTTGRRKEHLLKWNQITRHFVAFGIMDGTAGTYEVKKNYFNVRLKSFAIDAVFQLHDNFC